MKRSRLTAEKPRSTHARKLLAEAIASRNAIAAKMDRTKAAIRSAEAMVNAAITRVQEAAEAVEIAKQREAKRAQKAAANGGELLTRSTTLKEARAAEIDANDQLDAAETALGRLKSQIEEKNAYVGLTRDLAKANDAVMKAAKQVIADEIASSLPKQAAALHEEYIARMAALYWLVREDIISDDDPSGYINGRVRPVDPLLRNGPSSMLLSNLFLKGVREDVQANNHPSRVAWEKALQQLMADPEAPLPE